MRTGIDLGGTKIEAVALAADGAVLRRQRVATPVGDYRATLEAIRWLVKDLEGRLGEQGRRGVRRHHRYRSRRWGGGERADA